LTNGRNLRATRRRVDDGTLERIRYVLYEQCREQAQREAGPTAGCCLNSKAFVII
jgi:hypothetical protein